MAKYLRDNCFEIIFWDETKIGGEGVYVEIDESLFARKKNHVGKKIPAQ